MGMYANLYLLSDDNQRRLLADPALFDGLVDGEGESELALSDHEGGPFELDKAWHGLHFLLTGTVEGGEPPLSLLLSADGGTELEGASEDHYGLPRLYSAAFARRAHEALSALSDEQLAARFDGPEMMRLQIYPTVWDRPEEEPADLLSWVENLRNCLEKAAKHGLGVMVHIS